MKWVISWNPPPPPPKPFYREERRRTFQKLSHLGGGGVRIFLLERGDKPGKFGLISQWGVATFLLLFNHIYCVYGGRKVSFITFQNFILFELAMQDSHAILFCTKTWYHLYICDPFWWSTKMLTA